MIQLPFPTTTWTRGINALAFAFFLLALTGPCSGATKPAAPPPAPKPPTAPALPSYFYSIDLDSRYQIVGVGALTEETAAKAKCYRFVYDRDGRLQQIQYRRAGVPMRDPFFQATQIDFEYQPGIERRWYRTSKGEPMVNLYGVKGEELVLNAAGYANEVTNLDESGSPMRDISGVIHYMRTLDGQGRVIIGRRVGLLGTYKTDSDGYFETRSIYDNLDHRIEYGNYDSSGNALNNNDGVAIVRTTYTIYPETTQSIESYFDASGIATEEKSSGVHQRQRMVDQRGFLLSESYFDETCAPTIDSVSRIHERRYEYDDKGNRISESYFDVDGKLKNSKDGGYARVVYKYDDKDRVSETAYFGDDGTPQVVPDLGAAVVRQGYDDRDRIISKEFFDGQGHPAMNVNYGATAIQINVEGDTTVIRLCDDKGNLTQNPIGGYATFSYKTRTDRPLSSTNQYFNIHGDRLSYFPRVSVINPHLYRLSQNRVMQASARYGIVAAGIGALLAAFLAMRKSHHTKRRKVYVPTPLERFLAWLGVFAMIEGTLRFFMTVYWSWLEQHTARMGHGVFNAEKVIILFFLYRLFRLRLTMRVLNISQDDIHSLIRDFFAKANLKPEWTEKRKLFVTPSLDVRVRYFAQKYHAYLAFRRRRREGRDLARGLAQYIRAQVSTIQCKPRSWVIAIYYPTVAFCYFLLSGIAFYTFWQLIKHY